MGRARLVGITTCAIALALLSTAREVREAAAFAYTAGWNLIGGPDGSRVVGAEGSLYTFQPGDADYETLPVETPLRACVGYWAYFPTGGTLRPGTGSVSCSLALGAGTWALIGDPAAAADMQVSGASVLYTYAPHGGYAPADMLFVGQGAWAVGDGSGLLALTQLVRPIVAPAPVSVAAPAAQPQRSSSVPACDPGAAAAAYAAMAPLVVEFSDTTTVAANTPRIGLAAVIPQLQATRRQLAALAIPSCAASTQAAFDIAMDWRIHEFLDFLSSADPLFVTQDHAAAELFWGIGLTQLAALRTEAGR